MHLAGAGKIDDSLSRLFFHCYGRKEANAVNGNYIEENFVLYIYIYPFESPFISHREEMHNAKAKLNFVSPVDKQKCSSRGLNLLFFVESFFRELVERSTWEFYALPEEQWVTVGHGVNGSVPRSRCSAWTVCRGLDCTSRARDPEKEGAWSAFHGLPRN